MKLMTKSIPATLAVLVLLAGCGKDEDSDDNSALVAMADLQGTWNGECKSVAGAYGKTTITFTDSTFAYRSTSYADSGCATTDDYLEVRGTYALPGDTKTADGTAVAMIDYTTVAASWTFVTAPSRAMDWAKLCGDATVQGGRVDLLGKVCDTGTYKLNFSAKTYGILLPETKDTAHSLYLSDAGANGATAEARATTVDKTYGKLRLVPVTPAE